MISIENLSIRYPATQAPALDGISLAAAEGDQVGVTGRTGAGKSTLALASSGFIPRVVRAGVGGSVRVDGIDALRADAGALLGRVGIVFSTPANQLSASKLTVREELAFGLENLGMARAAMEARIDAVLHRLGIAHLAEREPFSLSGGEQQRVAIASIVAMGTRVLVLDEPTAQLDPAGTHGVAELLAELAGQGAAVLVAEHDPAVLAPTRRTMVLDAGRAVACDLPARALGSEVLRPLGMEPPTLVQLAEIAGIEPSAAFDEARVAAGLVALARGGGLRLRAVPPLAEPGWQVEAPATAASVRVEGLEYQYPGGILALRGVTLEIEPGQSVAIVGQNGSGKTTLVKHLNGLLRPHAGRVLLGGESVGQRPTHALARIVGFVFQNPDDQLFERSVEREVAFGPRTTGRADADLRRLVDASLRAVGLNELRAVNPYDLDLSRRKLVALGGVLAMDPAILVLDEPTTGQDGPGVARVGAIVDRLGEAGRTVIAITHDMEFAARHFQRIVVMRLGEVVADGPPAAVFAPDRAELLASTGLTPPPAARIAARLGLPGVPVDADGLLELLHRSRESVSPG